MRLFVSLRPPAHAVADLRAQLPRWPTPTDRWHVTLAFIGDAGDPDLVHPALERSLAGSPAFDLRLQGSGAFGRNGPVWVGVDGDLSALHALAGTVAAAARSSGIELEQRTYHPHVTVGKRGNPSPGALASYAGPTWRAHEVELVRSDLGRTVVHTVLERYPLR